MLAKCPVVVSAIARAVARTVRRSPVGPVGLRRAARVAGATVVGKKAVVLATAACVSVGVPALLLPRPPVGTLPEAVRPDTAPTPPVPPGWLAASALGGAVPSGWIAPGPLPGGTVLPPPMAAEDVDRPPTDGVPPGFLAIAPVTGAVPPLMAVQGAGPPDPDGSRPRCTGEEDGGATCRGPSSRPTPVDEPSALALATAALGLFVLLNAGRGRLFPSSPGLRRRRA